MLSAQCHGEDIDNLMSSGDYVGCIEKITTMFTFHNSILLRSFNTGAFVEGILTLVNKIRSNRYLNHV